MSLHNESLADREPESIDQPSKLSKVKDAAIMTGIFVIPVAITGASLYFGVKMQKMQLDAARLNLEAARLNKS